MFLYMFDLQKNNSEIDDDFNFLQLFQKSNIKNKTKIVSIKDSDYFKGNLSGCNSQFYKGLIKCKMYYIKNKKNHIIVEEYIFDNNANSKKSFQSVIRYSDFTRKLKRKDFNKRCYDIWDEQIYYATNENKHIYLLTMINDLYFKDKNTSVENIFIENKTILIDDLYDNLQ